MTDHDNRGSSASCRTVAMLPAVLTGARRRADQGGPAVSGPTPELRDELAVLMMMRGVDTGATVEDYQPEYMLRWQDAADNLIASDWFVREMAEAERRGAEQALRDAVGMFTSSASFPATAVQSWLTARADAIAAEPRP